MALSLNNIIRIKQFFRQGTIEALLVSYWQVADITIAPTYNQMAEAFGFIWSTVGQGVDILHGTAEMYRVVLDNLTLEGEYGESTLLYAGVAAGDPAPSFNAISVKQIVETRLTRAGYKRMPFISESHSIGNEVNVPTTVEIGIEEFWGFPASFFYEGADFTVDVTLNPVVVGRTLVELPEPHYVEDITKINPVVEGQIQRITSQNSRKT